MSRKPLLDKVVIITGSSRGIGRELARRALEWGARVVLNGRDPVPLGATELSLAMPERVLAVCADVSKPEGARDLVTATLRRWGRVDLLINNAGLSMRGAFCDLSAVTVNSMVEANLLTAVWMTREAIDSLRATAGTVVFVSSLAALRGFPGVSLYSATKMALTGLHQSLLAEEGPARVASCLVHLAFTENDPEKTTLGSDGELFQHQRSWSMTQKASAHAILRAAVRRRSRTILTATGHTLFWGQALIPSFVDWLVSKSQGKIHSVRRKE